MKDILETITSPLLDIWEPRHSGRILKETDRFIFLEESICNEYDFDPNSYSEAISDKDSENWQCAMKFEDDVYMI